MVARINADILLPNYELYIMRIHVRISLWLCLKRRRTHGGFLLKLEWPLKSICRLPVISHAEKEFMGLTTFAGSQPTLREAVVAKNYLDEKELRAMGQLVSGYLDFAERQAEREQAMTMQDWAEHLDRILTMSGEQLLQGNGSISHKQAVDKATSEYRKYKARTLSEVEQDYLDSIKQLEQKTDQK